jgi:hypothetical protein
MKYVGVLFILFVGVLLSTRGQALQVDCPFPEGTVEWEKTEERYVCKFLAAPPAPSRSVQAAPQIIVRQVVPIVYQTFPMYPYPFWVAPYWGWGGTGIYYGPSYYFDGYRDYGFLGLSLRFGGHHHHDHR